MGIGDSIKKGADNAMKDLAGTADKSDDAHTPDPGNPYDDVEVHSSLSEGSNAMEKEREEDQSGPAGRGTAADPASTSTPPHGDPVDPARTSSQDR